MAPGRSALFTSLTCGGCHVSLLKCLGVDMPPARSFQAVRSIATTASRARQSVARSDPFDSLRQLQELSQPSAHSPLNVSLKTEEDHSTPASDAIIPWYLRDQSSSPSTPKHLLDRQKIPALPPNPPPMLERYLTYISQDLGMDHLSLLDLRSLDPPAALGNNLIMIIGTARSEKHLNTAAHRCCRWLRTNFKLRPHADGLLGRNEMKLKVKRKNKRTKLLANVGSMEKPDIDDGIRTGWVCVHVGNVEPATTWNVTLALPVEAPSIVVEGERQEGGEPSEPNEEDLRENLDQGEGFVGFGDSTDGLTIVLQMFTEDKRSEVDLETLWSDLFGKFQRRANNLKNVSLQMS